MSFEQALKAVRLPVEFGAPPRRAALRRLRVVEALDPSFMTPVDGEIDFDIRREPDVVFKKFSAK
jgi:hypothetical protein